MALRSVPIRRAGNRPNLFLGGDREAVMFVGMLSSILILLSQDVRAIVAGIVMWVACLSGLRKAAKADPYMLTVYQRSTKYRRHYAARSTPFRINR
jgi:type IV secretion system protein TrbD